MTSAACAPLAAFGALLVACGAPALPAPVAAPAAALAASREKMVATQIEARGVHDPRVLAAMRTVPRHEFVPAASRAAAYADEPLPIGHGQTISQPYIVALMTELAGVDGRSRVLEVGTGSGYQAAVLAEVAGEVYTIEILKPLATAAGRTLDRLGYRRVHVRHGDGYRGWPEAAPFDAILVTAAAPAVPPSLLDQLAPGGRLVMPVGDAEQDLQVHTRTPTGIAVRTVAPVRFVPLVRPAEPAAAERRGPHDATARHSFADVEHWVRVFEDPARDAWQKPAELVQALGLRPGMTVVDLGAGTGYLSRRLSAAVGPAGAVLAVEPEPALLAHLRARAEKEHNDNVVPILGSLDNPRLPAAGADVVLIVDTVHHLDDRVAYFRRLRAALRPGGRVAIVDWQKHELPVGPPPDHKLARELVVEEMTAAGYALAAEPTILPYQYFLIFTPR